MTKTEWTRPSTRRSAKRWLSTALLLAFLIACSGQTEPPVTPEPGEQPGITPPPPQQQGRTLTTWTVDPDFTLESITDPQTRAWYEQNGEEIAWENTVTCPPEGTPPEEQERYPSSGTTAACGAIKHFVGRGLNYYVTSLLTVFRLTGDQALLNEVDRVMEVARSRLKDTDGDGFRNWNYLLEYGGDDFNLKEDSLSHGFIAEVAYVMQKNAQYGTPEHDFAAHADAWLDYLRNDFEGKWADHHRTQDTEGIPVHTLFHPYMEILRYNVYMAKLFPEDGRYARLHQRLSSVALNEFKTDPTPNGDAFIWTHVVRERGVDGDPGTCLHFQMGTYPQQTMMVFMDLALDGYPGFSDTVAMQKLSRTLSESIMAPTDYAFLYKDVGGLRHSSMNPNQRKDTIIDGWCFEDAPFSASSNANDNFRSEGSYQALTWGFLAAFAPEAQSDLESGKIYRVNEELYGNPLNDALTSKRGPIPAAMAFARLYVAGGYSLAK